MKSVLLIGLGNVAVGYDASDASSAKVLSHARAFSRHPAFRLAGGVDPDADCRHRFEAGYGVPGFTDIGAAMRELSPDVVVVATPTVLHLQTVMVVLAAGRPRAMLCEKPLATSVADAVAIVEACRAAGVHLMTAFPSRTSSVVEALAASIRAGEVGELVAFEGVNSGEMPDVHGAWFVDPELAGGGAVTDHVVHLADLYRWLTGSEVREVYAVANRILQDRFDAVETGGKVFLDKVFTAREQQEAETHGNPMAYLAMAFASKEAIFKSFAIGWETGVQFTEIEIKHGEFGEPIPILTGKFAELASQRGITRVLLSPSYDGEYAVAVAILV